VDKEAEARRMEEALCRTRRELDDLSERVEGLSAQDEAILDLQVMYLEDESFKAKVLSRIQEGYAAEYALKMGIMDTVDYFRKMDNSYLQERAVEIEDMGREVLANLLGLKRSMSREFTRDTILIASDLSPTDLIGLRQERLKGIALSRGGQTSHTSILARSFEIPMVIGVRDVLDSVNEGDYLIVDGNSGLLFSRPIREIIDEYARMKEEKNREGEALGELRNLPATTRDGHEVKLGANISLLSDLMLVDKYGADHIGLYRTEFPFLARKDFPSEEAQTDLYRRMLQGTGDRSTTIRTLDVGGDKFLSYLDYPRENNPYLGWRSIRVSLEMEGPFRTQIRAILRASESGRVKILFPMITSVEEILRIRDILEQEKRFLKRRDIPFDPEVPLGIMVEVPGTVRVLDRFLRYVDFVSIGTNDLIQYTLAVDRSNQKVSDIYNPLHPAVISLVHDVVLACRMHDKEVSICGEATAQPRCAYLFLGMGVSRMSMNPGSVPIIKRMLRNASLSDAKTALDQALEMETAGEISRFLDELLPSADPLP
jgi:phosphotransferase system enzyme I (PtsP)